MSTATMPLVQFFIPGVVAMGLDVVDLAIGCKQSNEPASRLSYRFTYRMRRDGSVYGCRIKASLGMATFLIEQLYILSDKAEAEGDAALLVGCELALEAIKQQTLH